MLNQECIRDILLFIDENQTHDSLGHPNTFKMKVFCDSSLAKDRGYSPEEIWTAVSYLCEKGMLESLDWRSKLHRIHISRITAKGYDYLQIIRDPSLWRKLCERFGESFLSTSATIAAETAMKFLFNLSNR